MVKGILFVIASIVLVLAIIGIFVPLLPTTPFLLLSVYLFSKSSYKTHRWLLTNKIFGKYIKGYKEKKSIPLRVKIISISTLWTSIIYAIIYVVDNTILKILLVSIAIAVSVHVILLKTLKNNE